MHTCLSSRAKEEIRKNRKRKARLYGTVTTYYYWRLTKRPPSERDWDCVSCVLLTIDIA